MTSPLSTHLIVNGAAACGRAKVPQSVDTVEAFRAVPPGERCRSCANAVDTTKQVRVRTPGGDLVWKRET